MVLTKHLLNARMQTDLDPLSGPHPLSNAPRSPIEALEKTPPVGELRLLLARPNGGCRLYYAKLEEAEACAARGR